MEALAAHSVLRQLSWRSAPLSCLVEPSNRDKLIILLYNEEVIFIIAEDHF